MMQQENQNIYQQNVSNKIIKSTNQAHQLLMLAITAFVGENPPILLIISPTLYLAYSFPMPNLSTLVTLKKQVTSIKSTRD